MGSRPDPTRLADTVDAQLRAVADPQRAEAERAYLKSDLEFLGMPVAAIRRAAKGVHRQHPDLDPAAVSALVEALWSVPVFERRLAAVEILILYGAPDVALVERLLRDSRTWALVDPLAIHVAGPVSTGAVLDRWVDDEDFWIRRSALLALLVPLRQGGGDPDRFFRYADRLLDEREFFVRKAIGWVLRELSKRRPELVRDWLEPRAQRASGVTMREAVKYLDAVDRDRLRPTGRGGETPWRRRR